MLSPRQKGPIPHVQNTVRLMILTWTRQKTAGLIWEESRGILSSLQYMTKLPQS